VYVDEEALSFSRIPMHMRKAGAAPFRRQHSNLFRCRKHTDCSSRVAHFEVTRAHGEMPKAASGMTLKRN
jgi:hypothetical protein